MWKLLTKINGHLVIIYAWPNWSIISNLHISFNRISEYLSKSNRYSHIYSRIHVMKISTNMCFKVLFYKTISVHRYFFYGLRFTTNCTIILCTVRLHDDRIKTHVFYRWPLYYILSSNRLTSNFFWIESALPLSVRHAIGDFVYQNTWKKRF